MPRATMQMRLLAAQANVEEKRIAELKARLKENLSLLDRERTCRELTRMQGELIKTSLFPHDQRNGDSAPPCLAAPSLVSGLYRKANNTGAAVLSTPDAEPEVHDQL